MKKFGLVLMMLVMASLLVVSAAAEITVSYDIVKDEVCVNADVYRVDISMLDNNGANFKSFATYITFDSNVLVPYDGLYDEAITDTANWYYCVSPVISNIAGRPAAEQISSTPGYPKVEATKIDIELYDSDVTSATVLPDNQVIVSVYFVLAEGKTLADVTEDVFKVNRIIFTNDVNMYDTNAASGNIITINNNVPQKSVTPTKLTIAVAAGDVVYLQDGTVVTITEANEAYEIPTTAGTVVVNSGFAGQKVYTVAEGAVTEDKAKVDGVIATNEASIRADDTASGIRYKSTFLTALKNVVDEYGYITTVESAHNALPADYVLNMALVNAGKAVKDEAYIRGTDVDIFWNVEDDKTIVTAVITNVPMTKEGVTTNIVIRPYYKVGELVVYGEPMTRTVYEVALNIKTNDADTYAKYQGYIDNILALCEESDVVIDFGPLFK